MKFKLKPKVRTVSKPKRRQSFLKAFGKAAAIGFISSSLMLGCGTGHKSMRYSGIAQTQQRHLNKDEQSNLNPQLIDAAMDGNLEQVRDSLSKGANVNAKSTLGWTALILASQNDHIGVVKLLLENGADINAKDNYNFTSLMWASLCGYGEIVDLLKKHGAK